MSEEGRRGGIRVTGRIVLDPDEIRETFVRASGPGGQHVNKVSSAVELRFDARRSPSLPEDVRSRLVQLAGQRLTQDGILIVEAQGHRSQLRNREEALAKLVELIRRASVPPVPRRPTKPTLGSKRRRLEGKTRRAQIKRGRSDRGE